MSSLDEPSLPKLKPGFSVHEYLEKRGFLLAGKDYGCPGNLYYEVYGTGKTKVLFISGMGVDRQLWQHSAEHLVTTGDYQACLFDLRGTGYSDVRGLTKEPSWTFYSTTAKLASDANELLNHLGWTSGVNLVGVSMGGMIGLELALLAPSKFSTLTLCSTKSGLFFPPAMGIFYTLKAVLNASNPRKRLEVNADTLYPKEWQYLPAPEGSDAPNNREFVIRRSLQYLENTRPVSFGTFVGQVFAVFRHYISKEKLKQLGSFFPDKRILVVVGTWDLLINPQNSHYIHNCLGEDSSHLHVFEGVGHAVPGQEPEKFHKLLVKHINSHSHQS
ncbi:hypothetical protein H4219_002442 [Mycoemilia scoparia]|uniref:AB hydrolase-1 domain-containing protein n=1 Tax=Mycoemilia scoparia TaxID=417184 RepID=A0A9W7ZXN8_9FUNG|nr:hypothetical protein H4219_002442 [Mycoemilia scoparia]